MTARPRYARRGLHLKGVAFALILALTACGASTAPPPPAVPPVASATPPPVGVPEVGGMDPAPITDGSVTVASVHGMRVLVERVPGAEFSAARLVIRGGVRNWTPERAGIEDVALSAAASGGTRALPKEQLARKLASLGATIGAHAREDFSVISGDAPTASFDDTFALVTDVLLSPALPASEIALVRERSLSERRHETENGDGRLKLLERRAVFAGHPYASRAQGSIETIAALTPDMIALHLAKLRETSRLVLVVVGDVDPARVIERARAAFEGTPRGSYVEVAITPLHFDAARAIGDLHPLATNYIGSFFVAPTWKDADYAATRVAMEVLSHRVWEEVRTKRNLSYAPWAVFRSGYAAPYAGFYVSTGDPSATMTVMMDEARRIQTDLVPPAELVGQKAELRTWYQQSREASEDEASRLVEGELYAGDWRFVRGYGDAIAAVSAEQIRAAARRYMTAWQTAIVGDPSKLDPKIVGATAIAQ